MSDCGHNNYDFLVNRIDELERRLTELEARVPGGAFTYYPPLNDTRNVLRNGDVICGKLEGGMEFAATVEIGVKA